MTWRDYGPQLTDEQADGLANAEQRHLMTAEELTTTAQDMARHNDFQSACRDAYRGDRDSAPFMGSWFGPDSDHDRTHRSVTIAERGVVSVEVEEDLDGRIVAAGPTLSIDVEAGAPMDVAQARALFFALSDALQIAYEQEP